MPNHSSSTNHRFPDPEWQGSSMRGGGAAPAPQGGDEGVDLSQLIGAIKSQWPFILLCGVVVFVLVVGHTMMSPMSFVSTGRLYLGEVTGGGAGSGDLDLSGGEASDLGSEMEILRSHTIVERAVLSSGLNVEILPQGWEAPKYWKWRYHKRDMGLLDAASGELKATETRLKGAAREARIYEALFRSDVEYELREDGKLLGTGSLGAPLDLADVSITLLPGASRAPEPGQRYDLVVSPLDWVTEDAIAALEVYEPSSSVESKVINLSYSHMLPQVAAGFLRHLMEEYLSERQAWKTENASAAEAFVTKQLHGMRESLDQTQHKLAEYREQNQVVVTEGETAALIEQLGRYEEQRVQARLEVSALQDIMRALRSPNTPLEAYMFGEAEDAVLQGLASSLSASRQKLTELKAKFKTAAPDVQQHQKQVDAQQAMVKNYVRSRLSRATDNVRQLNKVIGELEEKLRGVPGAELGLAQIGRESEVYSKMFSYLLERQQQTAILKASTVSKNRILDFPRVSDVEASPALGVRLASGIVGLLLGMFIVVVRTLSSAVLRSDREVRMLGTHTPIFASVPAAPASKPRGRGAPPAPPIFDVLAGGLEKFAFAEAFRTLRANLYYAGQDGQGRILLMTSPMPGDGKTTCTLSLAAMLAADEKRTLVIDADFRKPSHHELTATPLRPGLRGLLMGECSAEDVTHRVHLSFGSFDVINAGENARAEILTSPRLSRFLEVAREHYDFILLDSASYPLVSDALVLSNLADFTLSVVRLGNTERRVAQEHLNGIAGLNRRHALVVNNSVASNSSGYPYPAPPRAREDDGSARLSLVEAARQRLQ